MIDKETEAALLEEDEPQSGAVPQTTVEESEPPKSTCTPQVAEEAPEIPAVQQEDSVQQSEQSATESAVETPVPDPKIPAPKELVPELPEKTAEPTIDDADETEALADSPQPEESEQKTDDIKSESEDNSPATEDFEEKMDVNELSPAPVETKQEDSETMLPEAAAEDIKEESANLEQQEETPQVKEDPDDPQIENPREMNEEETKPDIKQEDDKDAKDERKDRKERKRKRSTSSERPKSPAPPTKREDEPEIDYSRVLLSWYDSDLNLIIHKSTFLSATPMHNDGFGYVWAGARAAFGYSSGKVYYEVKVTNECEVTLQNEEYPHVLRAGWSVTHTSMQLGEEKLSYGYGGTGKISTGNNFRDYGPRFGNNDVLGCYLDMSGDNAVISYTLNGESLGQAFSVSKVELQNKPLYPHILTKNCEFVCNFGDEEPWKTPIEDFVPVGQVDLKDRVPGPVRPERKEDCEILMMCGLPAAGKTFWSTKYASEHPEKMYNILGTNTLIDKMKVIGLPRKRNYQGRWDVLIDKCTRCLNKLLDIASSRRRNYILDQTNVYPTAQRRKMRNFYGFQRRAIVIVPTAEEAKVRSVKRAAVEGKDVPDSAIMEMKANFGAPVVGDLFDSVEWMELGEEEGKKLIAVYNKEGKDAGYTQQPITKRPRFEKPSESHTPRDVRSSRDNRDNRDNRDRRNAYPERRSSAWRGGAQAPSPAGWRDRGPRGGMRPGGGGGGGYGPPGGWRGRGGPSGPPHRGNDRRGPANDRRSGAGDRRVGGPARAGGWGPMNSNYQNSGASGWGAGAQSGWSGSGAQASGNWGSGQSGWGGQQGSWGSWKGYGSNANYNQSSYGQQGYGNGNWGGWNQQYYNQYWGQQQPASGQSSTTSGQSVSI